MAHNTPLISVILPLYNAEKYIAQAVTSILQQTYKNFEFIIIDDGSTDNSAAIVNQIEDARIKVVSQKNAGMAAALNAGLKLAKGEFIARQDADDIAYPERFQKQISYLQDNPDCALLGTWAKIISEQNTNHRIHQHPSDNLTIQLHLLFNNPFVHSSVMIRKSSLDKVGYYNTEKAHLTQDYDLWSRIARNYKVANLPEILQEYREVATGISQTTVSYSDKVIDQSIENMSFYVGKRTPEIETISHLYYAEYGKLSSIASLQKIADTFNKITDCITPPGTADVDYFETTRMIFYTTITKKATLYKIFGKLLISTRMMYVKIKRYV